MFVHWLLWRCILRCRVFYRRMFPMLFGDCEMVMIFAIPCFIWVFEELEKRVFTNFSHVASNVYKRLIIWSLRYDRYGI